MGVLLRNARGGGARGGVTGVGSGHGCGGGLVRGCGGGGRRAVRSVSGYQLLGQWVRWEVETGGIGGRGGRGGE